MLGGRSGAGRGVGAKCERGRRTLLLGNLAQRDIFIALAGLNLRVSRNLGGLEAWDGGSRRPVEVGEIHPSRTLLGCTKAILRYAGRLSHGRSRRRGARLVESWTERFGFSVGTDVPRNHVRGAHWWRDGEIPYATLFAETAKR